MGAIIACLAGPGSGRSDNCMEVTGKPSVNAVAIVGLSHVVPAYGLTGFDDCSHGSGSGLGWVMALA